MSRSLAIAPDGRHFLLGTSWYLRFFDAEGQEVWQVRAPGDAWAVNLSGDMQFAIAAFGDGTIRWYQIEDGDEVLALFPHRNGDDWVAWTPQGYYISSPNGDTLIGWHLNETKDAAGDFFSALQFERILYHPQYVSAYFRDRGRGRIAPNAAGNAYFDIDSLRSIAPPRIIIQSSIKASLVSSERVSVRIEANKRTLPMEDFAVFVNSVPITRSHERGLQGNERDKFVRELEIPLLDRENEIRVEVFNGKSMGVAETLIKRAEHFVPFVKGDLFLLAIGVNRFPGLVGADLQYAAQDAEALVRLFGVFGKEQFNRVTLTRLQIEAL